ncbi:hypothetical protein E4U49_001973 [Claviceps purpurea]|nr:hypothetical protein E4U49_001973 [Claviceps purpurea]
MKGSKTSLYVDVHSISTYVTLSGAPVSAQAPSPAPAPSLPAPRMDRDGDTVMGGVNAMSTATDVATQIAALASQIAALQSSASGRRGNSSTDTRPYPELHHPRGDVLRKESGLEDFNKVKDDEREERGAVVRAVRNPGPDILGTFGLAGRGNAGEQRGADVARGAEIGLHPRVPQAGVDGEKPILEGISVTVPRRVPREKVLGRRGRARRGVVGRDGAGGGGGSRESYANMAW